MRSIVSWGAVSDANIPRTLRGIFWQLLTNAIILENDVIILRSLQAFPEFLNSVSNSIQVHLDIRSSSEISRGSLDGMIPIFFLIFEMDKVIFSALRILNALG